MQSTAWHTSVIHNSKASFQQGHRPTISKSRLGMAMVKGMAMATEREKAIGMVMVMVMVMVIE